MKTYQITESELQALLKEQKQNCYDEAEIVYETLGSNNPEPVVSKRSILNAPTPDLSHLKEVPQGMKERYLSCKTAIQDILEITRQEYPTNDSHRKIHEIAFKTLQWDASQSASEEAPQLPDTDNEIELLKLRLKNQEETIEAFQRGLEEMFGLDKLSVAFFQDFKRLHSQLPDLKELRDRFEKKLCAKCDYEFCFNADYSPKEIFEWFISNLQLPKEEGL